MRSTTRHNDLGNFPATAPDNLTQRSAANTSTRRTGGASSGLLPSTPVIGPVGGRQQSASPHKKTLSLAGSVIPPPLALPQQQPQSGDSVIGASSGVGGGGVGSSHTLMGVLQCRLKSSNALEIKGYKKRFVLLNLQNQTISIYKNDQSLSPMFTFKSDRLRSVHYAAEKYSRFFQLIIRTHTDEQIRLLFETWEERDRWGRGLAELLDQFDTFNRRHSTMQLVERLCAAAGRRLQVSVSVTQEHFLENIPDALMQHVPEAVEKAIDTIQQVVTRGAIFRPPSEYRIVILVTYPRQHTQPPPQPAGVQYDPSGRCVMLHVQMKILTHKDAGLEVIVPQYTDVESIAQSRIFRNPLIESWLHPEENTKSEAFQRLRHLLPLPSTVPLLTFQWDQQSDQLGSKEVQEYVRTFISESFFAMVADEIELGIRMISRDMIKAALQRRYPPLVPMEDYLTAPLQTIFKDYLTGLSIRIDYDAVRSRQDPHVLLSKSPLYNEACRPAFLLNAIYTDALTKWSSSDITGTMRGDVPFPMMPTHYTILSLNTNNNSNSFTLEEKTSLSNQLFRSAMNIMLSRYLQTYRRVLRETAAPFDVVVNWGDLFQAYVALNATPSSAGLAIDSSSEDQQQKASRRGSAGVILPPAASQQTALLFMVQDFVEAYRGRLHRTLAALRTRRCPTPTGEEQSLLSVMERYVRYITVSFSVLKNGGHHGGSPGVTRGFATLAPSVRRGVLRDVMLCEPREIAFESSIISPTPSAGWNPEGASQGSSRGGGGGGNPGGVGGCVNVTLQGAPGKPPQKIRTLEVGEMRIKAAAVELSDWCAQFFVKGLQQSLLEEVGTMPDVPLDDPFCTPTSRHGPRSGYSRRNRHSRHVRGKRGGTQMPDGFVCPSRKGGTAHRRTRSDLEFAERYFGNQQRSDGSSEESDEDGNSFSDEDRIGDNVAIVRRDEVETIPLHQVRTTVYDSQGDDVRLKIGLEDITMAVSSLKTAKPGSSMFLHDVMHILMINLGRLREMFNKQLQSSNWLLAQHHADRPAVATSSALPLKKAVLLLNDYCEYDESGDSVEEVCRMFCRLRRPEKLVAFSAHLPLSVILWHFCLLERELCDAKGGLAGSFNATSVSNNSLSYGVMHGGPFPLAGTGAMSTPAMGTSPTFNNRSFPRTGGPGGLADSPAPLTRRMTNSEIFPIVPATRQNSVATQIQAGGSHSLPAGSTVANVQASSRSGGGKVRREKKISAGCCGRHRRSRSSSSSSASERGEEAGGPLGVVVNTPNGPAPLLRTDGGAVVPPCASAAETNLLGDPRGSPLVGLLQDNSSTAVGTGNNLSFANGMDRLASNRQCGSSRGGLGAMMEQRPCSLLQDNTELREIYKTCIDSGHASRVVKDGAKTFDFSIVADIALNLLLPMELTAAQRARRTGLLFGLDRTGKTLISNSLRGCARPTVATVGLMEQIAAFQQWILVTHELGGRECFRRNWMYYLQRAPPMDFLMFVVDAQNRVSFSEARKYLNDVLDHFPDIPLLLVFNNYPQMEVMERVHKPIDELERRFRVPEMRRRDPKRCVQIVTCDITLVHSINKSIPPTLYAGLMELSKYFASVTPAKEMPSMPKITKRFTLRGEAATGVAGRQEATGLPFPLNPTLLQTAREVRVLFIHGDSSKKKSSIYSFFFFFVVVGSIKLLPYIKPRKRDVYTCSDADIQVQINLTYGLKHVKWSESEEVRINK
eukprot:gene10971-7616_t